MRISLIAFALLFFSSCSTLNDQVFKEVRIGQTQDEVTTIMGGPDAFNDNQGNSGIKEWHYLRRADHCVISFKDQKVISSVCQRDPNKPKNYMQAFFQAWGQSMKEKQSRSISCQSHSFGNGNIQTTCD